MQVTPPRDQRNKTLIIIINTAWSLFTVKICFTVFTLYNLYAPLFMNQLQSTSKCYCEDSPSKSLGGKLGKHYKLQGYKSSTHACPSIP